MTTTTVHQASPDLKEVDTKSSAAVSTKQRLHSPQLSEIVHTNLHIREIRAWITQPPRNTSIRQAVLLHGTMYRSKIAAITSHHRDITTATRIHAGLLSQFTMMIPIDNRSMRSYA